VLALGAAAVAVGANPLGTASSPERIDVITRATAINHFVDVDSDGQPSSGDTYVFVDNVFLRGAPDVSVGEALGRCTLIDPATARFGCAITTSLRDGSIALGLKRGGRRSREPLAGNGVIRFRCTRASDCDVAEPLSLQPWGAGWLGRPRLAGEHPPRARAKN
jgi:hypothetical protein